MLLTCSTLGCKPANQKRQSHEPAASQISTEVTFAHHMAALERQRQSCSASIDLHHMPRRCAGCACMPFP